MTQDQEKKLRAIAAQLGVTLEELLKNGSPEYIIEAYDNKSLQILLD